MQEKIVIKGAREHNLKNISLELPRNKMVVFTGLSGSGKSSLAFDTIFAEGQRRYIESLSAYARQFLGGMQKPDVDEIEGLSPAISIDQKAHSANPRSTVATITEVYDYLRILYARIGQPYCPLDGTKIEKMTLDQMIATIVKAIKKEQATGKGKEISIMAPVVRGRKGEYYQMLYDIYNSGYLEVRVDGEIKSLRERIILSKNNKHIIEVIVDRFSGNLEYLTTKDGEQRLAEAVENAIDLSNGLCTVIYPNGQEHIYSTEYSCPIDGFSFPEIEPRLFSFNSPYGYCETCTGLGTKELFSEEECPVCNGKRLNNTALSVKVGGKNIWEATTLMIGEAREFFAQVEMDLNKSEHEIAGVILKEIGNRLQFMFDVGLHYLSLHRKAGTLSGGEAQRIRLASQVGTKLVGALYVLDEPTIGLHQRDNDHLVKTLRSLCDVGNTIIVVEHDEDTILTSDWLVDFGPGAGKHGGEVVFSGPLNIILSGKQGKSQRDEETKCAILGSAKDSLTGKYLRGEMKIAIPSERRKVDRATPFIKIKGAEEHNLKKINVDIPLRRFVCLTGVSGSGKSTLMHDILQQAMTNTFYRTSRRVGKHQKITGTEYLDHMVTIDQSPIGRTSRSNPATYTKAFDHIRDLFAETPEAKIRGYKIGKFSFNVPGGRCENCEGKGIIEIEMHFLPSVEIVCDVCKGKRFTNEILQVHYKGKNIADVLNMTIEDAEDFFMDIPMVNDKLKLLNQVGLSYLTLGQSATTLSGGEAQRIKLSRELSKRSTTKTLYLLDEPTTGLHYDDVRKLLEVLQRLVGQGNTVMVIEHNLDVIKCADWIIDLGPEGGDKGGQVIATGTPEEVAKKTASFTGHYLKRVLK
ncbi:MAG: ABC-ATPase UvrA [Candidatus Magasanikbacteria bacterium RIFCSPLOWO2_02_FULL_44_11]|uniref:UvrABC system protein A n=2 Tax=Candidatus Magasanikiibacteriota TaxID=1752731 RepID=A0A1F6NBN7_9BACT|nr:MAG: ABC-ATPase UvrA [Candidatus Magasanikbacteria bacterium RIFCSPHIGHO2_02_FULL_45_10]OGH81133.1 MAG: ABC-ATPase UvrA [Candidatus Magasanikbacteria bacterium RIFCSPLOWO2_02_FULL_44_11]